MELEESERISPRSIGDRIKEARKSKGLSQSDLASRIGVSQPAIANWESGVHDPRRLMLARLADVLDSSLDWLAAGDRSIVEYDKNAAAAYLRRPVRHVPVISLRSAALIARDPSADPHAMAEDYIPVTSGQTRLFAFFLNDPAVNLAFPPDTLVVVDYGTRAPADGDFCLISREQSLAVRLWRQSTQQFETVSTDSVSEPDTANTRTSVIGCVRVSIRIH